MDEVGEVRALCVAVVLPVGTQELVEQLDGEFLGAYWKYARCASLWSFQ